MLPQVLPPMLLPPPLLSTACRALRRESETEVSHMKVLGPAPPAETSSPARTSNSRKPGEILPGFAARRCLITACLSRLDGERRPPAARPCSFIVAGLLLTRSGLEAMRVARLPRRSSTDACVGWGASVAFCGGGG